MKNLTLLLFAFSCWSAISQLPENLKYDRLSYSYDSSTVFIQKGKVSSVYSFYTNQMEIGPTKNQLIHFPLSNNYAEILIKSHQLCIHLLAQDGHTQVFSSTDTCYIGFPDPSESSDYVDFNGLTVDQVTNETGNPENIRLDWKKYEIVKWTDDLYILNGFTNDAFFLDENEWLYLPGVSGSGVYSISEKKWTIDPLYKSCQVLNDFIFCLNADRWGTFYVNDDLPTPPQINYSYDVYQLIGNTANELVGNATQLDHDLLAKILSVEQLTQFHDAPVYATEKNGKKGLVHFQLMQPENPKEAELFYSELIPPIADFVNYSFFNDKVVAYYSDSLRPLVMYDYFIYTIGGGRSDFLWRAAGMTEVGMHRHPREDPSIIFTEKFEYREDYRLKYPDTANDSIYEHYINVTERDFVYNLESYFGLELQKNGKLVVNNWCPNYNEPNQEPLRSIQYPDEDSIWYNEQGWPMAVYPSPKNGFLKSGVYDLQTDQWIIDPKYRVINPNEQYYFLQTVYDDAEFDHIFILVDSNGTEIANGINLDALYANLSLLRYAVPYKADSLFRAKAGLTQHTKIAPYNLGYYVVSDQKLGLYQPGALLQNNWPTALHDFIHYHPDLKFMYYLEGDSLYLQTEFDTVSVSRNGKIIFNREDYVSEYDPQPYYLLMTIETNDTVIYDTGWRPGSNSYTSTSIELKNNKIIVNDCSSDARVDCTECINEAGQFYGDHYQFETENASVWSKTKNGWRQISPNYASISAVSNGWYIASSGSYFNSFNIYDGYSDSDGIPEKITDIPARYFLLDSNLNPIQYLDYFDFPDIQDLGFGIKIKLDSGNYFFMTYDGVAVTNAEWDHFEKENGKLKAIINTVYQIDEDGEEVLDEFGNPIEVVSRTVKYFRFP